MATRRERDRGTDRAVQHRLRQIRRKVGDDLARLRIDAAATKSAVAAAAGIDRTFYGRIEAGDATPGLETMLAAATALAATSPSGSTGAPGRASWTGTRRA